MRLFSPISISRALLKFSRSTPFYWGTYITKLRTIVFLTKSLSFLCFFLPLSLLRNVVISMAFKKILAQRILSLTKTSSQTLTNCRISSSSVSAGISPKSTEPHDIAPDPGDNGFFRSFLQNRPGFGPELRSTAVNGNLVEQLRAMDLTRNRIRLEGLAPPVNMGNGMEEEVTVEDARKLLKVAQVELVKAKLRETRKSCVSFSEFVRICAENCSDQDQAVRVAKMLDDSAAVIVLGDVVFLRPEQEIETLLFRKCKGFHI
ncbi:hypothetical protein RJT34_05841 [Clitoria ternatea]|uniref:Calcium uniporter protein n=1 Tax=Clitoria ternatea TaxID=43366 RepID=A0AAN9K3G5_CLITE